MTASIKSAIIQVYITQEFEEPNSRQFIFGDDMDNPLAAKFNSVLKERASCIDEVGPQFQKLGEVWERATFYSAYSVGKKETLTSGLQASWADCYPLLLAASPENRKRMLGSFARGLQLNEDRINATHDEYMIKICDRTRRPIHPAKRFWDNVHPRIPVSNAVFVFTSAFLELDGYPTGHTTQMVKLIIRRVKRGTKKLL